MTVEAELPDGRILEFPDGTDSKVIQATVKKVLGVAVEQTPAPTTAPTTLSGIAAEGGKGLIRGASDVGMMIGEGLAGLVPGIGPVLQRGVRALAQPSRSLVEAAPASEAERFAGTTGEIVGGMVGSGGVSNLRSALVTGSSALAGAAGEQIGGEVGQAAGAILPTIVDVALTAGKNIPKNLVARSTQKKLDTEFARRGEEIAKKTGVELSLGQQTGDEGVMLVEGMARKNPFSSSEFQKFGAKQVGQSVQRLQKILDDITPEKVTDITIGQRVQHAFDSAVDSALKSRRMQARTDFGAVDAAAGNAKVIGTNNVVARLDEMIDSFDVPGGGDATAALVNRFKNLRKMLAPSGEPSALTAKEAERLLEVYTKASAGKGQIFADLDTAQQRMLAGQLKDSLMRDLDAAAEASGGGPAALLKTARDNYRANSIAISRLEESVLGKFLGPDRSPERIADFLVRAKPSELKQTLDIVNKADPSVVQATRRYFVERAIDDSVIAPSVRNPTAPNFSAAKFIDAMPEGVKFEVLFGSSNVRGELKMVGEALERIAYRGFTEGSPTAPLLMAWDAAKKVFTLQGIAGLPAAVIAPRTVAKAALTPEGRRALITLGRYDQSNRAVVRAAGYLMAQQRAEQRTSEQPTANTTEMEAAP